VTLKIKLIIGRCPTSDINLTIKGMIQVVQEEVKDKRGDRKKDVV
jgi:hypothetical protein